MAVQARFVNLSFFRQESSRKYVGAGAPTHPGGRERSSIAKLSESRSLFCSVSVIVEVMRNIQKIDMTTLFKPPSAGKALL
jgi:hypothetical protein